MEISSSFNIFAHYYTCRRRRCLQCRFLTSFWLPPRNCFQTSVRRTSFPSSFLPSFTRNFASFSSRQLSGPLSTLILISRIPASVDAAGRFFRAIEGVRIVRREQTRGARLTRWNAPIGYYVGSQRLDMCTRRLQKLAETYANTRPLPRRHETEAYSRGPGCLFYT